MLVPRQRPSPQAWLRPDAAAGREASVPSSIPSWTPRASGVHRRGSGASIEDALEAWPLVVRQVVFHAREPMALASGEGEILCANEAFRSSVVVPESGPLRALVGIGDRAGAEVRLSFAGVGGASLPGVAIVSAEGMMVVVYPADFQRSEEAEGRLAALPGVGELRPVQGAWDGVVDRRGMESAVDDASEQSSADGFPMGLLVLDIDRFSAVNERYGRAAGDLVLESFVATVARCLRTHDQFGRFGAEDFVALLPKCDGVQAQMVAERIRRAVERMKVRFGDGEIQVTVSVGVAAGVPSGPMGELIKRADSGTYMAKRAGRNRVVFGAE